MKTRTRGAPDVYGKNNLVALKVKVKVKHLTKKVRPKEQEVYRNLTRDEVMALNDGFDHFDVALLNQMFTVDDFKVELPPGHPLLEFEVVDKPF